MGLYFPYLPSQRGKVWKPIFHTCPPSEGRYDNLFSIPALPAREGMITYFPYLPSQRGKVWKYLPSLGGQVWKYLPSLTGQVWKYLPSLTGHVWKNLNSDADSL